ncbi:MAG: DinB family protein [Bacteroidota bacterium]
MRALDFLLPARQNILDLYAKHSLEELNTVPVGFNNNLIWNAGHVIATMELLTYGLAGLKTPSGREFIHRYRKGTKPEGPASAKEQALIAERLLSGIDRLRNDLETLDFSNFKEYQSSFGVTLRSVEDALAFNNMHEAMHYGTMLQIRKLV